MIEAVADEGKSRTMSGVERLLRPTSVAIVGASDKPGALGNSVLTNLERNRFDGTIYPINPKREKIGEHPCLASVDDLPDGVDVAILAIPRPAVVDTVRALAKRGVGAAVIFSAGFAEGGESGREEQRQIAKIANEAGMLIEGPNCLGCVNYLDGIPLTFVETDARAPAGPAIGIVSQSGAMAAVLGTVLDSRDLGLSFSISTGNEAASGVEDYVEFLVDDPATSVIAMIVEQFRKPARFIAAARKAREAGKTIVLLHPGKSSAARESAATHTGAMAGDYQLMRTKVANAGVIFAETLEELGDITELVSRSPGVLAAGTVVLGESGAFKALTLDFCEDIGLPLPPVDDADAPALREALPEFVGVSNPLDLTAQGLVDPDMYARTLTALFDDDRFGSIVVGLIQTDKRTCDIKFPPVLRALREGRPDKPVIVAGLDEGARVPGEYISELRALGSAYFPSTERALRALARLAEHAKRAEVAVPARPTPLSGLADWQGVVPEYAAKQLLAPLGIAFPEGRFARSEDEAVEAARAIGGKVVMKAQSPALSHKSDAGGVALKLNGDEAIRAAWRKMHDDVARYDASIRLDGVLIEAMGEPGIELIVGARNDPEWGPVLLAGFGGVTAEILKDVRLLPPELDEAAVAAELRRLKSAKLFDGFRGAAPVDMDAAARLIVSLGRIMMAEPRLSEVDLNPVVLRPDGCVALDALLLVGE